MKIEKINPKAFKKLSGEFQKYIDRNVTGCVLCAVYHQDKLVYCNKFGWKDRENQIPIAFDNIFRMYSMTKPITCLAALILHEEGLFNLDDPLEKYLPEFKNLKILKSYDNKTGETKLEENKNPITIKHLFTHTSGLSYGDYPEECSVDILYGEEFGFTTENRLKKKLEMFPIMPSLDDFSKRLATLPLVFEPGKYWWYAFNHEILGHLIEKLSRKKLDAFFRDEIFEKLEMNDTDFYVPNKKWTRLTKVYTKDKNGKLIGVKGSIYEGFKHKIDFLSGGGGLVSTLEDYLKFCIMMLNGGSYKDKQILSRETIKMMTTNQLPNNKTFLDMQFIEYEDPESIIRNEGYGFGLGVLVKIAENASRSGIGDYSWGGAFNTFFNIDPANQVILIVMTQYCPENSDWIMPIDWLRIGNLIYKALKK
jgi:CubicO group peptidase (beta-lactamase class C family)